MLAFVCVYDTGKERKKWQTPREREKQEDQRLGRVPRVGVCTDTQDTLEASHACGYPFRVARLKTTKRERERGDKVNAAIYRNQAATPHFPPPTVL